MKICSSCKDPKNESDFPVDRKTKDGLHCYCKICASSKGKERYSKNPEPTKLRASLCRSKKRYDRSALVKSIKLKYGCRLCLSKEIEILDFHHLDKKDKTISLTSPRDISLKNLFKEINKCVVLCASCHRRVHAGTKTVDNTLKCKELFP